MSASERLERMAAEYEASDKDDFALTHFGVILIENALPELIAVVRWAESVAADHMSAEAGEVPSDAEELHAALAALSAKLA